MSAPSYHRLTVDEVIRETADAHSLRFGVPEHLLDDFAYVPGQHLQLHVPHDDGALPRCYSLSSNPYAGEPLQVTVKRIDDGRASNWICDHIAPGDTLEVMPPAGVFVPRTLDADLLMFAGGSGITPCFSILRSVLTAGRGHVRLIYANRDEHAIIFRDALAELAREHPERLEIIHWLDSVQGYPTQTQLTMLARGWERADCFVCGPGVFMDTATAALHSMGLPRNRVHVERFVSLPSDADALAEPAAPAADAPEGPVALTVHIDGRTVQAEGRADQPLLDAFQEAGIEAPFSCRSGACGACMCRLDEGSVTHRNNVVLDDAELAEGWILSCQALPTSSQLRITYPE